MTSPHLRNQAALHEKAIMTLRKIERIQKALSGIRASQSLIGWLIDPATQATRMAAEREYERLCSIYTATMLELSEHVQYSPSVCQNMN